MKAADELAGVLKNGSYIKNPTFQNINDLITSSVKIGSKKSIVCGGETFLNLMNYHLFIKKILR